MLFSLSSSGLAIVLALWTSVRRSRSLADGAFLAGMLLIAAEHAFGMLAQAAPALDALAFWSQWRFLAIAGGPVIWLVFSLVYARGNSREFLRRWRWALAGCAAIFLFLASGGWRYVFDGFYQTAEQAIPTLKLGGAGLALCAFSLVVSVLVLVNLERTYRAAVGTIRWRIKFLVLGVGVLTLVHVFTVSQALMLGAFDPDAETIDAIGTIVALAVMVRGFARTSQHSADVYPSISVLQGSVTVFLAGVYLILVGAFAKLATWIGGDIAFALKACFVVVALVGLAILLQSDRVRVKLRHYLSRNFQRPVYDYQAIWHRFTEGTASCSSQSELCRSVVNLTADIFQALSVSIWLANDRGDALTLGASTSLSKNQSHIPTLGKAEVQQVLDHFRMHPEVADVDRSDADWATFVRKLQPAEFANAGTRMCAPLRRQQQLIGILILGDRVSGLVLPTQDVDLLRCIADQAAASLLNIQMSERLLQAKQVEAFQTMATFFVHDLKNAASTLNLMLQNLPIHYDDPEFRADALRGIGKTVEHINRLIARLGQLRQEMKIKPALCNLNDIVSAALARLEKASPARIQQELGPVPDAMLDAEQIHKVVENLVVNAREAIRPDGQIVVSTTATDAWVILSVTDNGCGMPEEFLNNSLFKPFQTTKKQGIGIGMFQSRMLIEAHGGRIEATSRVGVGTKFQVFFPVAPLHTVAPRAEAVAVST